MLLTKMLDREKLYSDYYQKVKSYISSRIQNQSDIEDLASQVFLKIYEKSDSYDESKASLSTWIYTITKNTVIDFFRKQNKVYLQNENALSDDMVDANIQHDELLDELATALEKLDERERDIIILHYYSEKTLVTIAELMNISYPYIKKLHKKAINKLKKFMT